MFPIDERRMIVVSLNQHRLRLALSGSKEPLPLIREDSSCLALALALAWWRFLDMKFWFTFRRNLKLILECLHIEHSQSRLNFGAFVGTGVSMYGFAGVFIVLCCNDVVQLLCYW